MPRDPLTDLERALEGTAALVGSVREDQLTLSTPCRSWNVAALVDHVVEDLRQFTLRATGGRPDWSAQARPAGPDRLGAFRAGAAELLAAWRQAGDLTGTMQLPGLGEVPARFPVDQQIAEFAVHAWDLATATGQRLELDPEVAEAALAWARTALRPEFRGTEEDGKAFGPEVPAPPDASAADRLAAFFGRHPV